MTLHGQTRCILRSSDTIAFWVGAFLAIGKVSAQSLTGIGILQAGSGSFSKAVSADGSAVAGLAGAASSPGGGYAVLWTRSGGIISLGTLSGDNASIGYGISGDGFVVVGYSYPLGASGHAFRWTATTGMVDIGTLGVPVGTGAYAANADGSVIVGISGPYAGTGRGFRWTSAGMTSLGILPSGGDGWSYAAGASADGSIIPGQSTSFGGIRATRWTAASGLVDLGTFPSGTESGANAVSADGSTIVGYSDAPTSAVHACRWTSTGAIQDIGPNSLGSIAHGVSGDGTRIVGSLASSSSSNSQHPFLWTPGLGMVDLTIFFPSRGIDISGWTLIRANAISADGSTIVGDGRRGGRGEGWVAVLPACYANCDNSTSAPVLNIADFICFLQRFAAADPRANCDASTAPPVLNVADFICFQREFAAGCP